MMWIIAVAAGAAFAVLINHFIVNRLDGDFRTGLKVFSFIFCILLDIVFCAVSYLNSFLDKFIDKKISEAETVVSKAFPDANIFEDPINADEIQDIVQNIRIELTDKTDDGIAAILFADAISENITPILDEIEASAQDAANYTNSNGDITINSFITAIKKRLLNKLDPYFTAAKFVIAGLLLVYIIVCICIAFYISKGGALYNKAIVYGDGADSLEVS